MVTFASSNHGLATELMYDTRDKERRVKEEEETEKKKKVGKGNSEKTGH